MAGAEQETPLHLPPRTRSIAPEVTEIRGPVHTQPTLHRHNFGTVLVAQAEEMPACGSQPRQPGPRPGLLCIVELESTVRDQWLDSHFGARVGHLPLYVVITARLTPDMDCIRNQHGMARALSGMPGGRRPLCPSSLAPVLENRPQQGFDEIQLVFQGGFAERVLPQ